MCVCSKWPWTTLWCYNLHIYTGRVRTTLWVTPYIASPNSFLSLSRTQELEGVRVRGHVADAPPTRTRAVPFRTMFLHIVHPCEHPLHQPPAGVVLGDHFPPRYPSPCVFTAMSLQDDISQEYNEVFENFALQMEAASLVLYAFNSWCYQPTCAAY